MNRTTMAAASVIWLASVALLACTGEIGQGDGPADPNPPGDTATGGDTGGGGADATDAMLGDGGGDTDTITPQPACTDRGIGQQPIRRLSDAQYRNVLRDLLPATVADAVLAAEIFPETRIDHGFVNDAEANTVNTAESNRIEDNAEALANLLLDGKDTHYPALLGSCLPQPWTDADLTGCIDGFIDDFGLRAYRRPLTDGERQVLRGLYDEITALQGADAGFAVVMQLFLQAPALLYRVERGTGAVDGLPGYVGLSDYEMASRLSFFFLDSMPDAELFAAAAAGELRTPEQIEAQARRLVASPRAMDALAAFHRDWLRIYELEDAVRNDPRFDDAARQSLLVESARLVESVMADGDGSLRELLTTRRIPVDANTSGIYGATVDGDWQPIELDDRYGLLSLASVMASHAKDDETNVIERGIFVMEDIMCGFVPPFPGNIDTTGPLMNTAGLPTARERLSPLLERGDCKGCHQLFNPIGYGLETYDHVGAWRDTENDTVIDASGNIGVGDASGTFTDVFGLFEIISDSEQIQRCYTRQWFRFVHGRREASADTCGLQQLETAFIDGGGDIRELLVAITLTDAFMYRPVPVTEDPNP